MQEVSAVSGHVDHSLPFIVMLICLLIGTSNAPSHLSTLWEFIWIATQNQADDANVKQTVLTSTYWNSLNGDGLQSTSVDVNAPFFIFWKGKNRVLQSPISERLLYLAYTGALICLPAEEMSHAVRARQCHCALCSSFPSYHPSVSSFYAETTWFCAFAAFPCLSVSPSPLFSSSSLFPPGEPGAECRRYVEVRNITKGNCWLDNVEVSFCRGRCLSWTDVIMEV